MPTIIIAKPDTQPSSDSLISTYQANIETWTKRVQSLKQEKERENPPDLNEITQELDQLTTFLQGRLTKRLIGINQYPDDLRQKYLRCLNPFYTEEGISRFVTHYFDVEVFKQVRLRYRKKKDFEKEVNLLFDLFRVKKTIETITTLENAVTSDEPFPSRFAKSEQAEFLKVLKEIFKLFFLRFVKKEYRLQLFQSLSESNLEMDEIIEMRKSGTSYINPEVFQSNEYREKFITIYFSTLLRTKTSTEIKDLHFNYLNFELLKNEFLTDWMQRKLKGSSERDKVLQNYQFGGKTIAQLLQENPDKETEILSSLPLDVFNDIAEEVNKKVKDELKSPVTTFSKNHGLFAHLESTFVAVKQIARFSVEKMEEMKPKTKIWTVKKKPAAAKLPPVKQEAVKESPPKPAPPKALKLEYGLEVLKDSDLDFPYFDKRPETYKPKLLFLNKKAGSEYEKFRSKVWKLFNYVDKQHFIIRQDPCHEWSLPFLFSHQSKQFLLIIGAEISPKEEKAGYKSKWAASSHELNAYYLMATQERNPKFGKVNDIRFVRKVPFYIYTFAEKTVQNMAFTLLTRLFQTQNSNVFNSSNLVLRKPNEPFQALAELKDLLGLAAENVSPSVEAAQSTPPSDARETKQDSTSVQANEKPKVNDINEVARKLKAEMEAGKKNQPSVDQPQRSSNPNSITEIARKLKEEMAAEKKNQSPPTDPLPKAKPKSITDLAAQLKKEMAEEKAKKASAEAEAEAEGKEKQESPALQQAVVELSKGVI